ncbi:hypothetical protein IV203_032764 [Nitzschia inconspicua]|uniref:Uncharacterized protein n=1 Tax=Nitzschia inconspicua TaxID=303405 RepID=A0A9K3KK81_9STRA|nr:hypothetical protein IV203_032764 [Nitzschia inconspicua]
MEISNAAYLQGSTSNAVPEEAASMETETVLADTVVLMAAKKRWRQPPWPPLPKQTKRWRLPPRQLLLKQERKRRQPRRYSLDGGNVFVPPLWIKPRPPVSP